MEEILKSKVLILLCFVLFVICRSHQTKDDKRGGLVLDILHGLLSKYDNRIRPFAPDAELFVKVSFGGIEVIDVLESKEVSLFCDGPNIPFRKSPLTCT